MEDLISRQAAIEALADYIHNVDRVIGTGHLSADDCKDAAISVLADLPSADRPRGEWVEDTYGWVYCSHCKKYLDDYQMVFFLKPFDYCPNCGARMLKGGNYAAD